MEKNMISILVHIDSYEPDAFIYSYFQIFIKNILSLLPTTLSLACSFISAITILGTPAGHTHLRDVQQHKNINVLFRLYFDTFSEMYVHGTQYWVIGRKQISSKFLSQYGGSISISIPRTFLPLRSGGHSALLPPCSL